MTNVDQSPKDIEEITLAIALLGGLIAILLYIIDYFNNNVIVFNVRLQGVAVYTLMSFLLLEFVIIFLFFILKGISVNIEPENRKKDFEKGARNLFKISFIYPFVLFIATTLVLFFNYITTVYYSYVEQHPTIYFIIALFYSIIVMFISFWILFDLYDSRITKKTNEIFKNLIKNFIDSKNRRAIIIGIFIMILGICIIIFQDLFFQLLLDFSLVPAYLLTGSYSIDVFPQSNANSDTLTITIKETGSSFNNIYITLSKLENGNNLRRYVDNVTINRTKEASSNKTFCSENTIMVYGI